jgi:hypothetical protein
MLFCINFFWLLSPGFLNKEQAKNVAVKASVKNLGLTHNLKNLPALNIACNIACIVGKSFLLFVYDAVTKKLSFSKKSYLKSLFLASINLNHVAYC